MPVNVRDVTADRFETEVIARSHEIPVVVDFWAEWCGPCKVLGPTLERLAGEGGGAWELAKLDIDQHPQLAAQFGVQGIPTVIGFRDGQPAARFTGVVPEEQLRQFLDELVPSPLDRLVEHGHSRLAMGDATGARDAFQTVLAEDPSHDGAGLGLAGLLISEGDPVAAAAVLSRLVPSEAVVRLQALTRLSPTGDLETLARATEGGDRAARLEYAKALAADLSYTQALDLLLQLVAEKTESSEPARLLMLDLFSLLGTADPLTVQYRRRLASALF